MFGIDFSEILVIFAVALVVLGPERLPKLAATIGRWVGRARAMARQFREQLEQEANAIHHKVDLSSDFPRSDRPADVATAAADNVPSPGGAPAPEAPRAPPRADPPHAAAPGAVASAASGFAPLPADFTLADTHPAGLHPATTPPSPYSTPAAADGTSATTTGPAAENQQGSS